MENASKAGTQTKIAAVEDEANVIYLDLNLKMQKGEIQEVTMQDIAAKLNANGYAVKTVLGSGNTVTGILVEPTSLNLSTGQTATITVKTEGNTDGNSYYAVVDGKHYKINFSSQGITVARTQSNIEESEEPKSLTASSSNKNVVGEPSINGVVVSVTAGATVGESTITIKYGEYTKEVKVTVKVKPAEGSTETKNVNFSTAYGKIDVIWLEGETNNVAESPNAPELYSGANALKPVTWTKNGDTWTEDTTAKSTWYNYAGVEGTMDSNDNNMWANAKNADGSYFVWIPRYAYRITYYAEDPYTNTSQSPTGYYDGLGMYNAQDGSLAYSLEKDASGKKIVETVEHDGEEYIVHPAFASNLDLGGWSKNIKGFWVAKYEMSMADGSGTHKETSSNTIGNVAISDTVKAVSKPGVSSWRYINIANCYNNSYNYARDKESHLMKNSEWGAVAYLTESKYGRNGHEIDINNSMTYITGNGGGSTNANYVSGEPNKYNSTVGAKASTTGNIYGIYDMSGGAWEYTSRI